MSAGLHFPTFLLPSLRLPFRRPRASSPPTSPTSYYPDLLQDPAAPTKGRHARAINAPARGTGLSRVGPDTLRCTTCSTDVAFGAQIVSKGFTGRHGRAFLVSPPSVLPTPSLENLVNVRVGRAENRQLVTGAHVVADITCAVCGVKLGWKYVDAKEATQKYKVGKFILETQRVAAYRSWEDVGPEASSGYMTMDDIEDDEGDTVEFDSDDEDECEDIFAGTWDPEVAAQRRRSRVSALSRK
ncbi:yippee-domain-containing protein [Thozetella sp. PMI_491]|nr:yippee-domain-containing protein [Thozetella sp. PMI_491]